MPSAETSSARFRVCVDFGSTFTKASLVDVDLGRLIVSADHPTTIDTDVLDGLDRCLERLVAVEPLAASAEVLACSSAGGGLRIAVVGNEELVTAEAGRRVALSSGGKVVAVLFGGLDEDSYVGLLAADADVLLLVGGTDGGNAEVLESDAAFLAARCWTKPVVVAGNIESQSRVAERLDSSATPYVLADNVVPRIGELRPESARHAIREVFLAHVIGGKHLSARTDFAAMVRGATPDVVLIGVELLARGLDDEHPGAGDVVVVDIGGATTDVHSVVEVDPDTAHSGGGGLSRDVVAQTPLTRTVEGDLGMRWSAPSTVDATGLDQLVEAARQRRESPGMVPAPGDDAEAQIDEQIARAAVGLALRRHAGRARVVVSPEGRVVERSGQDLREVDLLVGSGGVLRNGRPDVADRVLRNSPADLEGGWQLPRDPRVVVDADSVLACAGLLAAKHPVAAYRLLCDLLGAGNLSGS